MTTTLTRFPEQQEALTAIRGVYDRGVDRVQLRWACGTGKTLVGRWAAQDLDARSVLVAAPSLALLAQLLAEWQAAGGWPFDPLIVCSDPTTADAWRIDGEFWTERHAEVTTDPDTVVRFLVNRRAGRARVVFSTYHSLPVIRRALAHVSGQFALAVADEAHVLAGQPDPRFRLFLDDQHIPARRRLFMTATPIVTAADPDQPWRLLSMDDKAQFGPTVEPQIDVATAIAAGRLADYRVLVLDANPAAARLDGDQRVPAVLTAAARHGLSRVISFHGRVSKARAFVHAVHGLRLPDGRTIHAELITGGDPTDQRNRVLRRLADGRPGELTVVANARCLAQGVNVPAVDGVIFGDPKESDVDITQAVGRALRTAPGKERGLVILPVTLADGHTGDDTLAAGPFAGVWTVLRALRAVDARLAVELDGYRSRQTESGRRGIQYGDGSILDSDLPITVDFAKIVARFVDLDNADRDWDDMAGLLEAWALEHGHTAIPQTTMVNGQPVGRWTHVQRGSYHRGELAAVRVARLERIPHWRGWNFDDGMWDLDRATVLAFGIRSRFDVNNPDHADTPLPHRTALSLRLTAGVWAARQRVDWRAGRLTAEQVQLCEEIPGWTWHPASPADEEAVDDLAAWVTEHRTAAGVPDSPGLASIRRRRVTGGLPRAVVDEITVVTPSRSGLGDGFDWRNSEVRWALNLEALRQYLARAGAIAGMPEHWRETLPDGHVVRLADWCGRTRWLHRRGSVPAGRVAQLDAIPGWQWEVRPAEPIDLGPAREHGTRRGYSAGCGCGPCVDADVATVSEPGAAPLVPVTRARGHVRILEGQIGRRARTALQGVTGLDDKTVYGISSRSMTNARARVRREVEAAVLAVTADQLRAWIEANPSPRDDIPAAETLARVQHLVDLGYGKAWISREMSGSGGRVSLQIGRGPGGGKYVRRETAEAVARLYERVGGRPAPPRADRTRVLPPLAEIEALDGRGEEVAS
jgi:superfamily II DNA or RNA helicase